MTKYLNELKQFSFYSIFVKRSVRKNQNRLLWIELHKHSTTSKNHIQLRILSPQDGNVSQKIHKVIPI